MKSITSELAPISLFDLRGGRLYLWASKVRQVFGHITSVRTAYKFKLSLIKKRASATTTTYSTPTPTTHAHPLQHYPTGKI